MPNVGKYTSQSFLPLSTTGAARNASPNMYLERQKMGSVRIFHASRVDGKYLLVLGDGFGVIPEVEEMVSHDG